MPPSEWIAISGLFIVLLVNVVTVAIYIVGVKADCAERINAVKELFYNVIKVETEKESKGRHDLANHLQLQMGSQDLTIAQTNRRFDTVVHKEDLHAMEARVVAAIDKIDSRVEKLADQVMQRSGD